MNSHEQPSNNENYSWGEYGEEPKKGNMMDAASRLEIVKNLRRAAAKENGEEEDDEFLLKQNLEYRESNPSPYGVTLGIEIEVPEESVLPPEAKQWNRGQKKKFLFEQKERYAETEKLGVPTDTDQFWEFAHEPAHSPVTLEREVQALVGMDLINTKYQKFPLHVTVGGISFEDTKPGEENNTHALARIMDATAWCTNGERLVSPLTDPENSDWTLHGAYSGILARKPEQVSPDTSGNISSAVEFRTGQLQSIPGLDRYLHSIYYLGAALRAYQNRDHADTVSKKLAKVWHTFAEKCETIFEEAGLPSPYELWRLDIEKPNENSPFKKFAEVLNDGLSKNGSEQEKFIHDIRQLVIDARAQAKEIIEDHKGLK